MREQPIESHAKGTKYVQPTRKVVTGTPGLYRTQRPSGDVYEFRVKGRWVRVPGTPQVTEAKRWRNQYLGTEKHDRPVATKITFAELADIWLAYKTKIRESTRENYTNAVERYLKPAFGDWRVVDVTHAHIARLVTDMQAKGLSQSTQKGVCQPLYAILELAVNERFIPINPMRQLRVEQRPAGETRELRIPSREEAQRLVDQARGWRPIVVAALFTGMRLSEIIGLTWADIDLTAGEIKVRMQLARRGTGRATLKSLKARRDIPIPLVLRKELLALWAQGHNEEDFVFMSRNGGPHLRSNVQRGFRETCKRAGVTGIRFHDMRHYFVSCLIENGRQAVHVSKLVGHSSVSITQDIYTDLFDKAANLDETRNVLDREATALGLM